MNTQNKSEQETGLSLSEARKLAKYYGNRVMKQHEIVQTPEEQRVDWECLSFCRGVILKKGRKKVNQES
ncbi:MAG: hypothetical protein IPJ01_10240 [Micavibrio sp.]|nr:hypothetical protein [Micavibrio sp.]